MDVAGGRADSMGLPPACSSAGGFLETGHRAYTVGPARANMEKHQAPARPGLLVITKLSGLLRCARRVGRNAGKKTETRRYRGSSCG